MFERLSEICSAATDNLAELADIAAADDPAFFDGAYFNGADLRGTDLRAFRLQGAVLKGAKIDETTTLPDSTSVAMLADADEQLPILGAVEHLSVTARKRALAIISELEKIPKHHVVDTNIRSPHQRVNANIPRSTSVERVAASKSLKMLRVQASKLPIVNPNNATFGSVFNTAKGLDDFVGLLIAHMRKFERGVYASIARVFRQATKERGHKSRSLMRITDEAWYEILQKVSESVIPSFSLFGTAYKSRQEVLESLMLDLFRSFTDLLTIYNSFPSTKSAVAGIRFDYSVSDVEPNRDIVVRRLPM